MMRSELPMRTISARKKWLWIKANIAKILKRIWKSNSIRFIMIMNDCDDADNDDESRWPESE